MQDGDSTMRHTVVAAPSRADGIGRALRSAFRGRLDTTPGELGRLLDKLR